MKKLFNAFMKRAIHDDEMERAQELAKGFPDDIALPQAMGFQAGYNAAIAELESEKSATENYDDIGYLVDKFNDQPLVSLTVTNISKFFDKACKIYHAKKCAECGNKWIRVKDSLPEYNISVICVHGRASRFIGVFDERGCFDMFGLMRDPTHWQSLPEPPHAL